MKIYIETVRLCFYWYSIILEENEHHHLFIKALNDVGLELSNYDDADIVICHKQSSCLDKVLKSKFYIILNNDDAFWSMKGQRLINLAKNDNVRVWSFAKPSSGPYDHVNICPNALMYGETVRYIPIDEEKVRHIDVMFSASLYRHCIGQQAIDDRVKMLENFDFMKYNSIVSTAINPQFYPLLNVTKILLCPLGNGPICGRDFEGVMHGAIIIKPKVKMITGSVLYNNVICCNADYSNLNDTINFILENYDEIKAKNDKLREQLLYELRNPQLVAMKYAKKIVDAFVNR